MKRRTLITGAAAAVAAVAIAKNVNAQEVSMKSGYAPVNGLEMYYEIHGEGGVPLVLIHGAFSAIGSSFSAILPGLSAGRQVIGLDLQAHGRTADIDRPLRIEQLADDVVALLDYLEVPEADVFGYSNGAAVALNMAITHPKRVRRLVFMSGATRFDGIQPGLMEGLGEMSWEMMKGTPWYEEYQQIAPRPEDFPVLFAKKSEMDKNVKEVPDDVFAATPQPIMIAIGDADLPTAEHAVKLFRLKGGGGFGDMPAGRPSTSQLLVIPGASHITAPFRADIVVPAINAFLDA
jgi:pimeloyl-ACP methyl ester carboxylesterase